MSYPPKYTNESTTIPALPPATGSAAAWKKFYDAELAEHERLARKYHEAGDTHGWNFHKGVASGLIKADIHMQQNAELSDRRGAGSVK
jgi:hypothetical protein